MDFQAPGLLFAALMHVISMLRSTFRDVGVQTEPNERMAEDEMRVERHPVHPENEEDNSSEVKDVVTPLRSRRVLIQNVSLGSQTEATQAQSIKVERRVESVVRELFAMPSKEETHEKTTHDFYKRMKGSRNTEDLSKEMRRTTPPRLGRIIFDFKL
jgi:hypothetical protein